jgi:hypothetical protein
MEEQHNAGVGPIIDQERPSSQKLRARWDRLGSGDIVILVVTG